MYGGSSRKHHDIYYFYTCAVMISELKSVTSKLSYLTLAVVDFLSDFTLEVCWVRLDFKCRQEAIQPMLVWCCQLLASIGTELNQ